MKRDHLLVGADWLRKFSLQSLLEIFSFFLAFIPLIIPVWQWYTGDANAARIHWLQLGVSAGSWVVLLATWPYIKQINGKRAGFLIKRFSHLAEDRKLIVSISERGLQAPSIGPPPSPAPRSIFLCLCARD